jgi:hypothetical protein
VHCCCVTLRQTGRCFVSLRILTPSGWQSLEAKVCGSSRSLWYSWVVGMWVQSG